MLIYNFNLSHWQTKLHINDLKWTEFLTLSFVIIH